eukprot:15439406-Alexandrium_andersonii.AAC.1
MGRSSLRNSAPLPPPPRLPTPRGQGGGGVHRCAVRSDPFRSAEAPMTQLAGTPLHSEEAEELDPLHSEEG